jgi:hypothetical protein
MTKFVNSYEYILREYSIKNYLNNTTKTVILEQIFRMIDIYNSTVFRLNKKILIDPEFPDEELITIMKPYLYLSLESNYSLVVKNKTDAKKKLIIKLKAFQSFNPNFGRRIIKFKDIVHKEKIKRVRSHIGFNMKYRPFNSYNIDNFMNNHLRYKYEQDEGSNDNNDNDNDNDDDSDELEHRNMLNSIRYYLNTQILNNNTREEEGDPNYNEDEEDDQDNQEDEEDNQDNNQDNQEDSELSEEEYNDSVS